MAEVLEGRELLSTITVNTGSDGDGADGPSTLSVRQANEINNGTLAIGSLSAAQSALASGPLTVPNTIGFAIPGAGPFTISPTSPLPEIEAPTVVDGYSEPGAHPNTNGPRQGKDAVPRIALDGSRAVTWTSGLALVGGGSTVRGLTIGGFGSGLSIASSSNLLEGNFIGTDVTGTQPCQMVVTGSPSSRPRRV